MDLKKYLDTSIPKDGMMSAELVGLIVFLILRVEGMPKEENQYQFVMDLLKEREIIDCDLSIFYDKTTPDKIQTINSLIIKSVAR